jgi:hypothetical protein
VGDEGNEHLPVWRDARKSCLERATTFNGKLQPTQGLADKELEQKERKPDVLLLPSDLPANGS